MSNGLTVPDLVGIALQKLTTGDMDEDSVTGMGTITDGAAVKTAPPDLVLSSQ
jgi:hypothetical protein